MLSDNIKNVTEPELITAVKNDDSEAFSVLFYRYLPMATNLYRHYYLRHFDEEDWIQEARIICYFSAKKYDLDSSLSFVRFYQMNFKNHIFSLIRKETAKKRKITHEALLFDDLIRENESYISFDPLGLTHYNPLEILILKDSIEQLFQKMTPTECQAFTLNTQEATPPVSSYGHYNASQVSNGFNRCRQKFKFIQNYY